jgi:hypothetical protein
VTYDDVYILYVKRIAFKDLVGHLYIVREDECHSQFLCQNQVLIGCVPKIIYCTHMGQKYSQIAKCHE